MEQNLCRGTRNDFSYFVKMALQNRMPWNVLAFNLNSLAPTLNETKEIIGILLKELETLQLTLKKKEQQLEKCQTKKVNVLEPTPLETDINELNDLSGTVTRDDDIYEKEVDMEYIENKDSGTEATVERIDNEWYTFVTNDNGWK